MKKVIFAVLAATISASSAMAFDAPESKHDWQSAYESQYHIAWKDMQDDIKESVKDQRISKDRYRAWDVASQVSNHFAIENVYKSVAWHTARNTALDFYNNAVSKCQKKSNAYAKHEGTDLKCVAIEYTELETELGQALDRFKYTNPEGVVASVAAVNMKLPTIDLSAISNIVVK